MTHRGWLWLSSLALAGCASTTPDIMSVAQDGERCTATLSGEAFALPKQNEELLAAMTSARKRVRTIALRSEDGVQYRCIGQAIFLAQRARFEFAGKNPWPAAR